MTLKQLLQRHKEVRGVTIGCCVNGSRLPANVAAHAHLAVKNERHPGQICVQATDAFRRGSAHVSRIVMHEVAHLIANGHHSADWRTTMRQLGQPIPAAYKKRRQ